MRNNSDGPTYETAVGNMAAFNKLPKAIRAALANADHNWSAAQIGQLRKSKARILHKGIVFDFTTIKGTLQAIKDQDKLRNNAL